ncbi:hypothetical protein KEM55_002561, partial [Ascosphaera atra]
MNYLPPITTDDQLVDQGGNNATYSPESFTPASAYPYPYYAPNLYSGQPYGVQSSEYPLPTPVVPSTYPPQEPSYQYSQPPEDYHIYPGPNAATEHPVPPPESSSSKASTIVSSPGVPANSPDPEIDVDNENAPYAQLIYRALLSARNHEMSLQQIYEWVAKNSNKGRDSKSRGWQNSIRHNLSMNAAFQATKTPARKGKPESMWKLTEEAIRYGVQSTTRYRRQANGMTRASNTTERPSPQRQQSGRKGGKAARRLASSRTWPEERKARPREVQTTSQGIVGPSDGHRSNGLLPLPSFENPDINYQVPLMPSPTAAAPNISSYPEMPYPEMDVRQHGLPSAPYFNQDASPYRFMPGGNYAPYT